MSLNWDVLLSMCCVTIRQMNNKMILIQRTPTVLLAVNRPGIIIQRTLYWLIILLFLKTYLVLMTMAAQLVMSLVFFPANCTQVSLWTSSQRATSSYPAARCTVSKLGVFLFYFIRVTDNFGQALVKFIYNCPGGTPNGMGTQFWASSLSGPRTKDPFVPHCRLPCFLWQQRIEICPS